MISALDYKIDKSSSFRNVINRQVFEFCSMIDGMELTNPFLRMLFDMIKSSAPGLFKKCPQIVCFGIIRKSSH